MNPTQSKIRIRFRAFWVSLLIPAGMFSLVGCGESQHDMMMRAARRARPKDQNQVAEESAATPAPPPAAEVVKDDTPPAENATDTTDGDGAEKPEEKKGLIAIEDRRPEEPMTETARRRMAFVNLEKITAALKKYTDERKGFPPRFAKASTGIPTLSWRVELLPYLGHKELYDKFDKNMPWNKEPNLSLLKYIPDEYVSPERWDYKTNFQVPARADYIFGIERTRRTNRIEDGMENTIMLLEVNESRATEWTRPVDFNPKDLKKLREEFGGLRKDGTFAAWANGWTVLLSSGLTNDELHNAMTFDKGDGQLAGKIHREITVADLAEASVAAIEPMELPELEPSSGDSEAGGPPEEAPVRAPESAVAREPVPNAAELAKAQDKLRRIFADQIREANYDSEKIELVGILLKESGTMDDDAPGAYALQTAAMRMSTEAGGPKEMISAVDQRVGRFEVDPYEENVKWMLEFGEKLAGRDPETVKGTDYLKRAVHVIHAGVVDNDFMRASAVARIAYRLTGQDREEEIPRLLNRLRTYLAAAQKEYDKAAESLAIYRQDPENLEAGAVFGRFLCFIKGDWGNGLPLIAVAGNEDVMEVAQMDLRGAENYIDKVALGDAWWALSRQARGAYRQAAEDRAVAWYEQAYEVMPDSLDRLHVKNRLDEAEETEGSSPLALCDELAEAVSVDLTISLAAMGYNPQNRASGRGRGGRNNDDDEDEYD